MKIIKKYFSVFSTKRQEAVIVCIKLKLSLTEENIEKVKEIIKRRSFWELSHLK